MAPRLEPLALALGLGLASLLCAACDRDREAPSREPPEGRADAKAAAIAKRVLERLGGADALEKVERIEFRFSVLRSGHKVMSVHHDWAVAGRRDEVTWLGRDGHANRAEVDLRTKKGRAWRNQEPLEGAAKRKTLDEALERWRNDTYWLLAPYEIRDPGVVLTHEGEIELERRPLDVLRLRFEDVSPAPADSVRMYVDRASNLVVRWDFVLEGRRPSKMPSTFDWTDWARYGPLWIATRRVGTNGRSIVRMEDVRVVPRLGPES